MRKKGKSICRGNELMESVQYGLVDNALKAEVFVRLKVAVGL